MRTPLPSQPPEERKPEERTPSNGWDLLDDYQVGKEVHDDHEQQTRRFIAPVQPQQIDGVELPPAPEPQSVTTARMRLTRFWRTDGSAENDAATIAKIMGRQQEANDEAQGAIDRAAAAKAKDERDRIRERQQREIEEYLALQRSREKSQAQFSNSLQQMMQDVADIFLALGICPDHLEWIADAGVFCSWGGKVYDHSELFTLRDSKGLPVYTVGPGPDGPSTVCFSPRERRWKLDQPVPSQTYLTPVERLLPVPRRHADGQLRFSAQRARTLLMHEGSVMVYVVNNRVYTTSHLRAAHHLHSNTSVLDKVVAPAASMKDGAAKAARSLTDTVGAQRASAIEKVTDVVGSATDSVTRLISSTTRLFRRDRKP
jgi:hypothetical protein